MKAGWCREWTDRDGKRVIRSKSMYGNALSAVVRGTEEPWKSAAAMVVVVLRSSQIC